MGRCLVLLRVGLWCGVGLADPDLHHGEVGLHHFRAAALWWRFRESARCCPWEAAIQAALMSEELRDLRAEVQVLREDLRSLEEEVRRLRRAFAGLRAQDHPAGYPDSEGSYSLLGSAGATRSQLPSSPARSAESVGIRSTTTSGGPVAATAGLPLSWAEREEIAEGIGLWIRRCLEGGHRGTSGRDRNPLQSRLWLVIRSIEGEDFNPPLAFRNWTSAKAWVKRGAETGGSIFIGLPSEREAVRAVRFAGLEWSGNYSQ